MKTPVIFSAGSTQKLVDAAPAPAELADPAGGVGLARVHAHPHAEAEAVAGHGQAVDDHGQVLVRKAVGGEEVQGRPGQERPAVGRAPGHQHVGEAAVVLGRGEQAVAAALVDPRFVEGMLVVDRQGRQLLGRRLGGREGRVEEGGAVHAHDPRAFFLGHVEGRVGHAEGGEQALFQQFAEGPVGDHLGEMGGDVDGDRIMVGRARLVGEGEFGDTQDQRFQGAAAVADDDGLGIALGDRAIIEEVVAEARGVGQQVGDIDGPARGLQPFRAVRLADQDLAVAEMGQEARQRVVEAESPLLPQHQEQDRDDRLGHGIDAVDRALGNRQAAFRVAPADPPGMEHAVAARDAPFDAAEVLGLDMSLHGGRDALRPLLRECALSGRHFSLPFASGLGNNRADATPASSARREMGGRR